ncbi:RDD family protein [Methylophaga pinxianii]|uniref:RDD family protein n=1 Tax=Methylophaga pinxianii TaxID=2881052 RepID=UPI001CF58B88|nr:RDD family protein [Methylophaga pinxianii]MCB2427931.1 RDD family protein [Methylophaga pinxianii]UPH44422.1 RDD family protein [Methylophaga pinxianii]
MTKNLSLNRKPSLFRLLGVMLYDTMLLVSVLLVASAVAVAFNGGEAIGANNPFFFLYLVGVAFIFYGWFWTHGGQTLGMRAWQVYLISGDHIGINWQQAFLRFVVSIFSWLPMGLGYWWLWLSPDKLSWHDIASGSFLIYRPKQK